MPKQVYSPKLGRRELFWVGSTLDELRAFPEEVRREVGHALHLAQIGEKSPDTKPLRGFKGAGVLEVVENFDGNAYRAVYTVRSRAACMPSTRSRRSPTGASRPLDATPRWSRSGCKRQMRSTGLCEQEEGGD